MKSKYSTYSWRKYIGAPEMLINSWCITKLFIFFQYCYSNIGLCFNLAQNIFLILDTPIFISPTVLEC